MSRLHLLRLSSLDGIRELADDADQSYSLPTLEGLKSAVGEILKDLRSSQPDLVDATESTRPEVSRALTSLPALKHQEGSDSEKLYRTFQTKIVPIIEHYDEFGREERIRALTEAKFGVERSSSPLIVLASLVEKTPNLGGITRTAEIFGVERVVVHDRSVVKDARFQALAATADRWVPISEVGIEQIESYLVALKKTGYTVVALEQTLDSVSLERAELPEKMVLLLGRCPGSAVAALILTLRF
jgi:tRNA(Leu) C34 or U34 (ribose-2'-O)-methylase TrmL